MTDTVKDFKTFNGLERVDNVDLSHLMNALEREVSQFDYFYREKSRLLQETDEPLILVRMLNNNIPHLMNLSSEHHVGLGSRSATTLFEAMKAGRMTLEDLRRKDSGWFSEAKEKIIGVFFLYQLLNLINSKAWTTRLIIKKLAGKRFSRDAIYLIISKFSNDVIYSLELSLAPTGTHYFPKSLKINDKHLSQVEEIELELLRKQRIKSRK